MKSTIYFIGYCCIALVLASCSKDEEAFGEEVSVNGLQYMEFIADVGIDTRMQLVEGNKVEWLAGDAISVFDGKGNRLFTTKDTGATAVFSGKAVQASTYYALYPYQQGATIEGNVLKNVTLPATQTAKAGSFDAGFNLSVALTTVERMQFDFKNVISLVKFSVNNEKASEVRSVKLTSHDANVVLAGTVDINISDQPTVITKSEQQSTITLNAPNGLETGKDYYFSVLPGTLSKGFTLTFANSEGKTWQKSSSTSLTTNRSNIVNLKSIEIGTFTKALLTNANLIAAAEASSGQSFIKNADGTVSLLNPTNQQIVNTVTNLDLSDKNDPTICDEIHFFTSLKVLECSGNTIENLDVSANLALVELYCTGTSYESYIDNRGFEQYKFKGLKVLDVSKNSALRVLYISNNQLKRLDLSSNSELEALYAARNGLVSVDVSKCLKLKKLNLWINNLTNLDVSNNTMLDYLVCSQNEITSLNVTHNTLLRTLYSGANNFTSLDVSKNTQLTLLFCDWSLLTEIDISHNAELETFNCYNSKITTLDLSHNTELLDLHCGSCQLSDLNVSSNLKLESLQCYDNKLTTLDLSNNSNLNYLICFMNQMTSLDITDTNLNLGSGFGNQMDNEGNNLMLTLYVNPEQYYQELGHEDWSWTDPYVDDVNINVNVVLKSEGTHEGFTETNYSY